jgi:hypothetical protein
MQQSQQAMNSYYQTVKGSLSLAKKACTACSM